MPAGSRPQSRPRSTPSESSDHYLIRPLPQPRGYPHALAAGAGDFGVGEEAPLYTPGLWGEARTEAQRRE